MEIVTTIAGTAKLAALSRALLAYNQSNPALTEEQFVQKLVDGQLDGLVKAYVVTQLTKLAFLNRFTSDERIAIRTAAQTSPAIHDYLAMLDAAQDVDLLDARTIGGVQALEAAGLLAEGRGAEILAL